MPREPASFLLLRHESTRAICHMPQHTRECACRKRSNQDTRGIALLHGKNLEDSPNVYVLKNILLRVDARRGQVSVREHLKEVVGLDGNGEREMELIIRRRVQLRGDLGATFK